MRLAELRHGAPYRHPFLAVAGRVWGAGARGREGEGEHDGRLGREAAQEAEHVRWEPRKPVEEAQRSDDVGWTAGISASGGKLVALGTSTAGDQELII